MELREIDIKKKVVIITDGNKELGLGHIYQSITLADYIAEYYKNNIDIEFLTKSEKKIICIIKEKGYSIKYFSSDEKIFFYLKVNKFDIIIFDKLYVSVNFVVKIKSQLTSRLVIFNTLTDAKKHADISVFTDFEKDNFNLVYKDSISGKISFWGPKYWILRNDFLKNKSIEDGKKLMIKRILILFGGSDPLNLSTKVLEHLNSANMSLSIDVILGPAFEYEEELHELINNKLSTNISVRLLKNVKSVYELMMENDLVFASPGLSFVEALALGKPVIGFHQNEIQKNAYRGLFKTLGVDDINKLSTMIKDRLFICSDNPLISKMEIGKGKDELISEILR